MTGTCVRLPALAWLSGARVQRVDGPRPGCVCLTLFERGQKQHLVLLFGADARGIGTVTARPKGDAASGFIQRLRRELEGGRLEAASWLSHDQTSPTAQALELVVRRAEQQTRVVVDFDGKTPNLLLLREDGSIAGAADESARRARFRERSASYEPTSARGVARSESAEELARAGETLLSSSAQRHEDAARARALATTRAALKRCERKVAAIQGDLDRAHKAPRMRREAQLLVCHLDEVPRGASSIRLLDESVEPPEWLEIELDPAKDARRIVQERFDRARRLERGVAIASARLADSQREAEQLRARLAALAELPLASLEQSSSSEGAPAPRKGKPPQRLPYRAFRGSGGQRILVGKGAADNDALTLTIARPQDHWLHARGVSGSHVVVPLERNVAIPQELLVDAAHLAAHFSKLRGEPIVDVQHTERRFVRKAKGSSPGSVQVDRERVLVLRLEPTRLARLLASE